MTKNGSNKNYSKNSANNLAIDWPTNDVLFDFPLLKRGVDAFLQFVAFCCKSPVKSGVLPTYVGGQRALEPGKSVVSKHTATQPRAETNLSQNCFFSNLFLLQGLFLPYVFSH